MLGLSENLFGFDSDRREDLFYVQFFEIPAVNNDKRVCETFLFTATARWFSRVESASTTFRNFCAFHPLLYKNLKA